MTENAEELIAEAREACEMQYFKGTYQAGLMERLADALEARQPSEDDREALARVMDTLAYYHCRSVNPKADHPRMGYHAMTEDQREHLREKQREAAEEIMRMIPSLSRAAVPDAAGVDAVLNRLDELNNCGISYEVYSELHDLVSAIPTAVPDAATEIERYKDAAEGNRIRLVHAQNDAERFEAERDAALAAIERVRVAKHEVDSVHQIHGADCLCGYSSARSRSRTEHITEAMLAALDGAPEPETAPENYEPKCNGACAVHGSPVTNWPVQYGRRNRETGALHWLKGDPFDSWWHENQDRYEHVKRYTSPPLPVEGDSE